jgi:hypothetical protein
MDDTSLDDFLSGDDSEETASATDESESDVREPASDSTRSQQEPDDSAVTDTESAPPALSTSRWDADGVSCAACGETVQRVWDAPDGLVCATCKEW